MFLCIIFRLEVTIFSLDINLLRKNKITQTPKAEFYNLPSNIFCFSPLEYEIYLNFFPNITSEFCFVGSDSANLLKTKAQIP